MPSTPLSTSPRSGLYFVSNRQVRRHGMRALLNSLGLTLWSAIAIVLAVGLAMVGYRVSLSMKDLPATTGHPAMSVAPAPSFPFPSVEPSFGSVTPTAHGQRHSRVVEPEMRRARAA